MLANSMLTMSLLGLYKDAHVSMKSLLKRCGCDDSFLEFLFPGVKVVISGQRAQPKSKPPNAKASAGEGEEEGEGKGEGGGEGLKGAGPSAAAGMGWATAVPAREDETQRQQSVVHYLPHFAAAAAAAAAAASTASAAGAASGQLRKGGKSTADNTLGLPPLDSRGRMRGGGQAGPSAPQVEKAWPSSAAELQRGVNDTWNAFQALMKGESVTIQQWKAARTILWKAAAALADASVEEEEEVILPWPSSAAELRRGDNDTWNAFQVLKKGFRVLGFRVEGLGFRVCQ
jgi:hypothetical protein